MWLLHFGRSNTNLNSSSSYFSPESAIRHTTLPLNILKGQLRLKRKGKLEDNNMKHKYRYFQAIIFVSALAIPSLSTAAGSGNSGQSSSTVFLTNHLIFLRENTNYSYCKKYKHGNYISLKKK